MSYDIEFDRQFIRSTRGITPVWLSGENNVTTGRGRDEKVYRKWGVFLSLLGVTKEEFLDHVKPLLGSNEHWRKGGKWINDEDLIKWVENGCRLALPVEDIIECNYFDSIDCKLMIYDGVSTKAILNEYVSTTFEFDKWLDQAKEEIEIQEKSGYSAYPVISFNSGERIAHSTQAGKKGTDKVLVKKRGSYLVSWTSNSTSWSRDASKALALTYDEALEAAKQCYPMMNQAQYVSAKVQENPGNLVIKITSGKLAGQYLNKLTRGRVYYSSHIGYARKYSTKAAAQKAANRIIGFYGPDTTVEIIEYDGK